VLAIALPLLAFAVVAWTLFFGARYLASAVARIGEAACDDNHRTAIADDTGPIEISPAVRNAFSVPPPGHLAPDLIEAFGASLEMMRRVWLAAPSSQPFAIPGSGTTAMEMVVANVIEPGDATIVINTGYFSDRMVEMLKRAGAEVVDLTAVPGEVPNVSRAEGAFDDFARAGRRSRRCSQRMSTPRQLLLSIRSPSRL
jgi:hypothetical protein